MSSGFITESELADAKRKRQEEWEKVRTADQPLERPEEPYDPRPLYERLKEQKVKKDMEYEEAHKLKNLIRGLDDDEVEFLDFVDRTKLKIEEQQQVEEEKELKEFRARVATLQEQSQENKIHSESSKVKPKVPPSTARTSQKSLLGRVIRKRNNGEMDHDSVLKKREKRESSKASIQTSKAVQKLNLQGRNFTQGALKCIGLLPGIGKYTESSSDSEYSSDSDDVRLPDKTFNLIASKIKVATKNEEDD